MFSYKPKGKMTDLFSEDKTFSHISSSLSQGSGTGDGGGRVERSNLAVSIHIFGLFPLCFFRFLFLTPVDLKLTDCQNILRVHSGSVENLTLGCAAMVCKPPYVKGRRVL